MSYDSVFAHYRAHLERVTAAAAQALAAGGHEALVIHSGTPHRRFRDDYELPFKVNPLIAWWAPVATPHCALYFAPGARPALWYWQPEDYWYLPPAAPDERWAGEFELVIVRNEDDWRRVTKNRPGLAVIAEQEATAAAHFPAAEINPVRLIGRLEEARTVKSDYEIACLAAATARAERGHRAAAAAFARGAAELEIHLAYLAAARAAEENLPYHNIVALNEHAAVLHYQGLDPAPPAARHSFLLDAGAEFAGFAADITRTYAAGNGLFADLVTALDDAQQRLVTYCDAGSDYRELHLTAHSAIAGILHDAGIVRLAPQAQVEQGISRAFFPHGLGHFLGLQVHDAAGLLAPDGTPRPRPEGHPYLRLTRDLEAGNVLTVEPGLYFIPQLLAGLRADPDKARHVDWDLVERLIPCGGIRIEDNVVIQPAGPPRNLTREAFAAAK